MLARLKVGVISTLLMFTMLVPLVTQHWEEGKILDPHMPAQFAGSDSLDILMLGNSYTQQNNLASLTQTCIQNDFANASATSLTSGGLTLANHANNTQTLGHQWNTTLNNNTWDWVILQDQSQVPSFPTTDQYWQDSLSGASVLNGMIENSSGQTLLMMTWGRRDGDSTNQVRNPDFSTMQANLDSGYRLYAENLSKPERKVWIAPVGLAFKHIHDQVVSQGANATAPGNTFYELYAGDGSHPSINGSYLAAYVIYSTITGWSPVGLPGDAGWGPGVALELQLAAAETVFNETPHLSYPWENQQGMTNALGWAHAFQGGGSQASEVGYDIAVVDDGSSYIVGHFWGDAQFGDTMLSGSGEWDIFVAHLFANGTWDWALKAGGSRDDRGYGIAIGPNGGIYVTGSFESTAYFDGSPRTSNGRTDIWIGKVTLEGTWDWVQSVGANRHDEGRRIVVDEEGQVSVLGFFRNTPSFGGTSISSNGYRDIFVSRLTSNGSWLWTATGGSGYSEYGRDIILGNDGDVYITGDFQLTATFGDHSMTSTDEYDVFVAHLLDNGTWDWLAQAGGSGEDKGRGVYRDADGNITITGYFEQSMAFGTHSVTSNGANDLFVARLLPNLTWDWALSAGGSGSDYGLDITGNEVTGPIVGGYFSNVATFGTQSVYGRGGDDIFLAGIDDNNSWGWAISGGGNDDDNAYGMTSGPDETIWITGRFDSVGFFGSSVMPSKGYADMPILVLGEDSDGDGAADVTDNCQGIYNPLQLDPDGDGFGNECDLDDDNDGFLDEMDNCSSGYSNWIAGGPEDWDSDGCHDDTEDDNDDQDTTPDLSDYCPRGIRDWNSNVGDDIDWDGCQDSTEDLDDDKDTIPDLLDSCPQGEIRWFPSRSKDHDFDGCTNAEDSDDDGDGIPDSQDRCSLGITGWTSNESTDHDSDGCSDEAMEGEGVLTTSLTLGSSTATGVGASDPQLTSVIGLLHNELNETHPDLHHIDLSAGGATIDTYLGMLPEIKASGAEFVTIIPFMDSSVTSPNDIITGYSTLLDELESMGATTFILNLKLDPIFECGNISGPGGCYQSEDIASYNSKHQAFISVANGRNSVHLIPLFHTSVSNPNWDAEDGIHLNDDGHQYLFENFWASVVRWLNSGGLEEDFDNDNDGIWDDDDACPNGLTDWDQNQSLNDHDLDGCNDIAEDDDDDNDGIMDINDYCPHGETGWLSSNMTDHDSDGCRDAGEDTDDDNDQVLDNLDVCAKGETEWFSDETTDFDQDGCRDIDEDEDDDNDNVPDIMPDLCPKTPPGEEVNSTTGCGESQLDDDEDGVFNDEDNCTATPSGYEVDDAGCADFEKDTDSDGVTDDLDLCNDTSSETIADANGCADYQKDSDDDGYNDDVDLCPHSDPAAVIPPKKLSSVVNEYGCSQLDRDNDMDGVDNSFDNCPSTPHNTTIDAWGCPLDSDADGVIDDDDSCPGTPKGDSVNVDGCSLSKGDQVAGLLEIYGPTFGIVGGVLIVVMLITLLRTLKRGKKQVEDDFELPPDVPWELTSYHQQLNTEPDSRPDENAVNAANAALFTPSKQGQDPIPEEMEPANEKQNDLRALNDLLG